MANKLDEVIILPSGDVYDLKVKHTFFRGWRAEFTLRDVTIKKVYTLYEKDVIVLMERIDNFKKVMFEANPATGSKV